MRRGALLVVAGLVAVACAATKVSVVLLSESMCPNCQDFIRNDLYPALHAEGIWEITSLAYIPWGNTYCETTSCPSPKPGRYDADVRKCWNAKCTGSKRPTDCFNLTNKVCQHGEDECRSDRLEACAIGLFGNTDEGIRSTFEFAKCIVVDNLGKSSSAIACAAKAGLNWNAISMCANSASGDAYETTFAEITNDIGPHQGVPWFLVDGQLVQENALAAICNAYTGVKPAGCRGL